CRRRLRHRQGGHDLDRRHRRVTLWRRDGPRRVAHADDLDGRGRRLGGRRAATRQGLPGGRGALWDRGGGRGGGRRVQGPRGRHGGGRRARRGRGRWNGGGHRAGRRCWLRRGRRRGRWGGRGRWGRGGRGGRLVVVLLLVITLDAQNPPDVV